MPGGGEVRLATQESRDRVVISITDTGTGMTADVKTKLFDPFFSTKGKAGTGMGLAVSFGIVRRHEGSIEVDSDLGRGTTFRISLPKVEPEPTRVDQNIIAEAENTSGERKTRVLVVDDETPVRNVLLEALEAEGCEVFAAQDGVVALEIYDRYRGQIDIVFTDIGMPEMNGWELVTALRQRSKTVPVAIVSGWADAIGHEKRSALKADWVVAKPFDIEIISKIARDIAQRRLAQMN